MNRRDLNTFIKDLKNYNLSKQQKKTLRGLALSGDLVGAKKGLNRLVGKAV